MAAAVPELVERMLRTFATAMREKFGDRLARLTLFGSYARGEADPIESDVDVLVVVDDMTLEERREIVRLAAELGVDAGYQLSALCMTSERFNSLVHGERLLAREIERDGVAL